MYDQKLLILVALSFLRDLRTNKNEYAVKVEYGMAKGYVTFYDTYERENQFLDDYGFNQMYVQQIFGNVCLEDVLTALRDECGIWATASICRPGDEAYVPLENVIEEPVICVKGIYRNIQVLMFEVGLSSVGLEVFAESEFPEQLTFDTLHRAVYNRIAKEFSMSCGSYGEDCWDRMSL